MYRPMKPVPPVSPIRIGFFLSWSLTFNPLMNLIMTLATRLVEYISTYSSRAQQ